MSERASAPGDAELWERYRNDAFFHNAVQQLIHADSPEYVIAVLALLRSTTPSAEPAFWVVRHRHTGLSHRYDLKLSNVAATIHAEDLRAQGFDDVSITTLWATTPAGGESDALRRALEDAIRQVSSARKGSIGSIDNVYLPQIYVRDVERWRAALAGTPSPSMPRDPDYQRAIDDVNARYGPQSPPARDWQPIATAPRDGTRVVILYEPYADGEGGVRASVCRWNQGTYGCGRWLPIIPGKSTHWMPLPAVPQDTREAPASTARRRREVLSAALGPSACRH